MKNTYKLPIRTLEGVTEKTLDLSIVDEHNEGVSYHDLLNTIQADLPHRDNYNGAERKMLFDAIEDLKSFLLR